MIRSVSGFFTSIFKKYLPDAFLFSVILTFAVFLLGWFFKDNTFVQMTEYWGNSFWNLNTFSMQMVLILVTGHTLAQTPFVNHLISSTSKLAIGPKSAVALVTVVATLASWFNWGFGLIVGGLIAIEVARRVKNVHFSLLVASAYSGFLVWHGGLSGSIPLKAASNKGFLSSILDGGSIPISETIFSPLNLTISIGLLLTLPLINILMHPKVSQEIITLPQDLLSAASKELDEESEKLEKSLAITTPAERLENSGYISIVLALMGFIYIFIHFNKGGSFDLNIMNFIFLFSGILLHKTPMNYLRAFYSSVKNSAGIILQFPLYAGIMGMMKDSGLTQLFSEFFINVSSERTFPLFTYFSAGIVNFFVPSGGGQWAVQGPIMIPAAKQIGVSLSKTALAIAWGDAWTNMLQPFWALPLLGLAKIKLQEMMGFCVVSFLWAGVFTTIMFLIF